ncbi:hypothetical protein [Parvibacter caecicola]|uniref:hypothetical protein n=1 Tax=Parvibacter caecicola TaxID=747645 RepID=UPI001B7F9717|nr:hypothetical protein [Parvibacter caecicola]
MRYKRHKQARKTLKEIEESPRDYLVIHYSCESFYDIHDGRTPRITSIAVRELDSGQTHSFSIHKIAEKQGVPLDVINGKYDELEKAMLDELMDFIQKSTKFKWVHWNMRDINYGFPAIYHRYEVLNGTPCKIDDSRLIDIARVLKDCYGEGYAGGHPRMQKLLELNDMSHRELLSGKGEAVAFSAHEYVKLHQSTLRKVNEISNIVTMACENKLKTASSLIEIYGWSPQSLYEMLRDRWWFAILAFMLGVVAGLVLEKAWSF